jgi:hypothetical protein
MTDLKDEIARMIEAAEEAAYQRGFKDACDRARLAVNAVADTITFNKGWSAEVLIEPGEPVRKTGRPASPAITVVEECINASPGKKGVDVVKAVHLVNASIPERTVRTCLRRLKENKKIWQRNGLWYPKPVERYRARVLDAVLNDDEEENNSPPHQ